MTPGLAEFLAVFWSSMALCPLELAMRRAYTSQGQENRKEKDCYHTINTIRTISRSSSFTGCLYKLY